MAQLSPRSSRRYSIALPAVWSFIPASSRFFTTLSRTRSSRVGALRAAPPRVGDRRAHELGARPVVELAVGDADDRADLRTSETRAIGTDSEPSKPSSCGCIVTTLQRYSRGDDPEVHGRSYGSVRLAARRGRVNEPRTRQAAFTRCRGRSLRGGPGRGIPRNCSISCSSSSCSKSTPASSSTSSLAKIGTGSG